MIRPAPAVLAALALLAGGTGGAAPAAPAAKTAPAAKHDNTAPIDWEADRIEVQDRDHRATLIGNVRVVQQELTLTADRVVAVYTGSIATGGGAAPGRPAPAAGQPAPAGGKPRVQRLDANGHVVVTRPGEVARGDYGIDDLATRIITLIGHVTLDRNGSVVRGGRLVIDQNTDRATVDGSAVGGAGPEGKGGRVSGRFIVDDSNAGATARSVTPGK